VFRAKRAEGGSAQQEPPFAVVVFELEDELDAELRLTTNATRLRTLRAIEWLIRLCAVRASKALDEQHL